MAAVENRAEGPSGPAPTNLVELPKLAPRPRRRPRLVRLVLLVLVPLIAVVIAGSFYLAGGRYVSTDDAYARAPIMNVTNEIAGIVKEVDVRSHQQVATGDMLFRLDDQPYIIALAGAEAQLAAVRNELVSLKSTYRQNLSQVEQAKAALDYANTAFARAQNLVTKGVTAQASLDQARRDRDMASQQVAVAQRAAEATLSQLGGDPDAPVEKHPRMLAAEAAVDKAKWDLDHTKIVAPWSGTTANVDNLKPGRYLAADEPAMSLVGSTDLWIEANPKETDLTYVKTGNPAMVTVDAYPGITWKATVTSVSPATGAEFSVLPPQNASGNWVKVVQRVPVKLAIEQPRNGPRLRAGMSVTVEIDTGHRRSLGSLISAFAGTSG
jgi:membrane fusion protein (multidrug efflux system)